MNRFLLAATIIAVCLTRCTTVSDDLSASGESCSMCHGSPPSAASHPVVDGLSDPHDCSICHPGASARMGTVDQMYHRNDQTDFMLARNALDEGSALCATCHTAAPVAIPAHVKALALPDPDNCSYCHAGSDVSTPRLDSLTHMNGMIDIALDSALVPSAGKALCSACHDAAPSTVRIHSLIDSTTYGYDCAVCHTGNSLANLHVASSHANGVRNLAEDSAYSKAVFNRNPGMTVEQQTCSAISCHGEGRPDRAGVVWTTSATFTEQLDCMGCHNTSNHSFGFDCSRCHSKTVGADNAIIDYSLHINGTVELR